MAKRLYTLHLSTHKAGMVKGPVDTVAPVGVLFDLDDNGNQVVPDRDAVAQCLPHFYRKPFARAGLSQVSGREGFYYTLYNSRGAYLNTVYAVPYNA